MNDHEEVLLVKHTYTAGWHLPGGKNNTREIPEDAIRRELLEELGLRISGPLSLFSRYQSQVYGKRDTIDLFLVRLTQTVRPRRFEIASAQWYSIKNLPDDMSPGTQRRLEEFKGVRAIEEKW